jgi:hypothetical protein
MGASDRASTPHKAVDTAPMLSSAVLLKDMRGLKLRISLAGSIKDMEYPRPACIHLTYTISTLSCPSRCTWPLLAVTWNGFEIGRFVISCELNVDLHWVSGKTGVVREQALTARGPSI